MAVLKIYDGTDWVDVALSSHAATHTDGSDDVQSATASQKGLATAVQITKLDGIEALADVTDAINVAAAGALFDVEDDTSPTLGGSLVMGANPRTFLAGANPLVEFGGSASSPNYLSLNAGSDAFLTVASGSSGTNVDVRVFGKGTGMLTVGSGGTDNPYIKFDGSTTVGLLTYDEDPGTFVFDNDIDVTGNIVVSGTVDGRDIDADGTKLDTIETSATADQTAAEIKTAYESNSDTNEFDDAEQAKLSGIEASADVTDEDNVNAAGAVMISDVDAKGDIFVATANDVLIRLPVGTNDFVLTADSGEASGVKWAAAAGGGDLVDDLTPQLGGDLQSNTFDIDMATDDKVTFRAAGNFLHSNAGNELTLTAVSNITLTAPTALTLGASSTAVNLGASATNINIGITSVTACNVGTGATATNVGKLGGDIVLGDNSGAVKNLYGEQDEWTIGKSGKEMKEVHSTSFFLKTRQTYTLSNFSTVRTYNASTDGIEELEDLVLTFINDMITGGLVKA